MKISAWCASKPMKEWSAGPLHKLLGGGRLSSIPGYASLLDRLKLFRSLT